jgi:hypothetical protein
VVKIINKLSIFEYILIEDEHYKRHNKQFQHFIHYFIKNIENIIICNIYKHIIISNFKCLSIKVH